MDSQLTSTGQGSREQRLGERGRRLWRNLGLAGVLLAGIQLIGTTGGLAQNATEGGTIIELEPQKSAVIGQITGSVMDANGDLLLGAQLILATAYSGSAKQDSSGSAKQAQKLVPRQTETDSTGHFRFVGVPAGRFMLTATAPNRTGVSFSGQLLEGQTFEVPAFRLELAETENVQVVASQEELAQTEVKAEEHQRLGGVLPNFFVSYDFKAPPLRPRQKFDLAFKNAIDPGNFIVNGLIAGVQQAANLIPGYGRGWAGYGKRLGADEADLAAGTFIGGAILPVLFHQDPRYFWKGTGTVKSRALYAVSTAFRARGDNGKWQPAYASILGDIAAGALTNLYYPKEDHAGVALTFENGLLNVGSDAIGNLVQEFLLRKLTPHPPIYGILDKD